MQTPTLLYIECAAPGLLRLDGAPFAQTPAEGLCRYVARTALTMEFLPMGNPPGGVFLPFARQIDLSADAPRIFENDGAAELFVLPAEAFALRLHPPALPRPPGLGYSLCPAPPLPAAACCLPYPPHCAAGSAACPACWRLFAPRTPPPAHGRCCWGTT